MKLHQHLLLALAALLLAAHAGSVAVDAAVVAGTGAGARKMLQYEELPEEGACCQERNKMEERE